MPALIAARLYRIVPLLVVLGLLAVIVYVVVAWRTTPNRAKEVLIKFFVVLNAALSGLFALATLYAWIEGNAFAADFFLTCLATTLVILGITWLCRWRFRKNHPNYRWKLTRGVKKEK